MIESAFKSKLKVLDSRLLSFQSLLFILVCILPRDPEPQKQQISTPLWEVLKVTRFKSSRRLVVQWFHYLTIEKNGHMQKLMHWLGHCLRVCLQELPLFSCNACIIWPSSSFLFRVTRNGKTTHFCGTHKKRKGKGSVLGFFIEQISLWGLA